MALAHGSDVLPQQAHTAALSASSTCWASATSQYDTQTGIQAKGDDVAPPAPSQQHTHPGQTQGPVTSGHQGQAQMQTQHWSHGQQQEAQPYTSSTHGTNQCSGWSGNWQSWNAQPSDTRWQQAEWWQSGQHSQQPEASRWQAVHAAGTPAQAGPTGTPQQSWSGTTQLWQEARWEGDAATQRSWQGAQDEAPQRHGYVTPNICSNPWSLTLRVASDF